MVFFIVTIICCFCHFIIENIITAVLSNHRNIKICIPISYYNIISVLTVQTYGYGFPRRVMYHEPVTFYNLDYFSTDLWEYSILDDIPTRRFSTIYNVYDTSSSDLISGTITRIDNRGSYLITGEKRNP